MINFEALRGEIRSNFRNAIEKHPPTFFQQEDEGRTWMYHCACGDAGPRFPNDRQLAVEFWGDHILKVMGING